MKKVTCPRCGYEFDAEPEKTWTLTSLPDKQGNITVTVMGTFRCPSCGRSFRAVYAKYKTGSMTKGKSARDRLIEILNSYERISLDEISEKLGYSKESIRKAIFNLLRQGLVKGRVEGDLWIKLS